jgi:hypothetical protein
MNRYTFFILTLAVSISMPVIAQNIAINNDGTPPHASAMLDVKSSTKGFLLPRMDSTARKNISFPAKGLLVFDTSDNNLWQYANSTWSPQFKLPGTYHFNESFNSILSITNDGTQSPIYVNANYAGATGIETHGGRYGLFGKSEGGTGAQQSVGVVGTYYGGFTLNGTFYPSTGGIGVLALGGGGFGPSSSLNPYHFGLFASAKDYGVYATALPGGIAAQFKGQTWMQGTQHYSHFNYGGNEDTYIRGGKDNAIVVIADGLGQKGTVGTGSQNEDAKLTIDDPNSTLYSGVNATSNGIKKDTFQVSGGQYEQNDHRPAVKAIGAFGGNALEIDGQVAVTGNNKFVFYLFPQISNPNAAGFVTQNGPYWEISLKHTILDDISYSGLSANHIFITPYIAWSNNNPDGFNIPSRQILLADNTNGGWKYVVDVNPLQVAKAAIQLFVMVIRTNPVARPL